MKLSIVSTIFCSEKTIDEFINRTLAAAGAITDQFEIIIVDDGSPDDSNAFVKSHVEKDPRIKLIELSRNHGHHKAIMTGLSYASGDVVFLINCDLEEDPENLQKFITTLDQEKCDVVYGAAKDQRGSFFRHLISSLFRSIFNFLAGVKINKDMLFSRVMSKRYVKNLLRFKETDIFVMGLWHFAGYKQVPLPIRTKFKGYSSYTIERRIEMGLSAITSFSDRPLRYISYLGINISVLAFLYSLFLIVRKFLYHDTLSGWTSVIVSIWLMGGLLMSCLGVVGIYLSKIFIETKHRPIIVKDLYLHKDSEPLHSEYIDG